MPAVDYILHGSWSHDQFFVWAETSRAPRKSHGVGPSVPLYPFAASETALRIALQEAAPLNAGLPRARRAQRVILLPSDAHAPRRSAWLSPDDQEPANGLHLAPWRVNGLALDMLTALDLLVGLPLTSPNQRWCGVDLRYWGLAARVGLECLAQHRYIPGLEEDKNRFRAVWTPVLSDPGDQVRLRALAQAMPPACRALFKGATPPEPAAAPAPHVLLDSFIATLLDQTVRAWGAAHLNRRRKAPDGVAGLWWAALWDASARLPSKGALNNLYAVWQAC